MRPFRILLRNRRSPSSRQSNSAVLRLTHGVVVDGAGPEVNRLTFAFQVLVF
jgi:hypothetical protein